MHYFAYASNMDLNHLRRLCGWHCHLLGKAILKDYEIGVDSRGFANVCLKKGAEVYGILFEVDEECISRLDDFQGYPQVFDRKLLEVLDVEDGQQFKAWVYIENEKFLSAYLPYFKFWERIVVAAKENKLPKEWIKNLEKFWLKK